MGAFEKFTKAGMWPFTPLPLVDFSITCNGVIEHVATEQAPPGPDGLQEGHAVLTL